MSIPLVSEATLLEKADMIALHIQRSDAALRFWQARDKMEHHEEAQQLFEELKRKTNNSFVIRDQLSPSHPRYQTALAEVQALEEKLAEIPVAMQYKEAQDELNGLMQEVVQILLGRLSKAIPVELGPKQGCGNNCTCGER